MKYYFKLFNAITDAIELLKSAQQEAEETFVSEKQVFFWRIPDSERCGLVKAEDPESAFSMLFDMLGGFLIELKGLTDGECFYEAERTSSTAPKSSQLEA